MNKDLTFSAFEKGDFEKVYKLRIFVNRTITFDYIIRVDQINQIVLEIDTNI
jgi:hypothetical protein